VVTEKVSQVFCTPAVLGTNLLRVSILAVLGVTRFGSNSVETAWTGPKRPRTAPVVSSIEQMFLTMRGFSLLASESELLMNDSAF
jgi:hypothetical protein